MMWYVYIIRCADDSLYAGVTTDVDRRFAEHRSSGVKAAKYLRGRGPLQLVYTKKVGTRSDALREELRIKRLSKLHKERLLASVSAP